MTSEVPAFITPQQIECMTDDQVDQLLLLLRSRRLKAYEEYKEGEVLKKAAQREKITARLAKHYEILCKDIVRADALNDKLNARVQQIRVLKMQLDIKEDVS